MSDALPWERVREAEPPRDPALVVDLRRCLGCHACSIACKTENETPLGEFRMRVRWLQRPDRDQLAFVPVFDPDACDDGSRRTRAGLDPACVTACPSKALNFGDLADPEDPIHELAGAATPLAPAEAGVSLKDNVTYIGAEDWMADKLHRGAALDPRDEDIIYEQGGGA